MCEQRHVQGRAVLAEEQILAEVAVQLLVLVVARERAGVRADLEIFRADWTQRERTQRNAHRVPQRVAVHSIRNRACCGQLTGAAFRPNRTDRHFCRQTNKLENSKGSCSPP